MCFYLIGFVKTIKAFCGAGVQSWPTRFPTRGNFVAITGLVPYGMPKRPKPDVEEMILTHRQGQFLPARPFALIEGHPEYREIEKT
jgi:hypothetical protein